MMDKISDRTLDWMIKDLEINDDPTLDNMYDALIELHAYRAAAPLEKVRELVKAFEEGRMAVLPCKVGDAIFVLTNDSLCGFEETVVNRIVHKRGGKMIINADCKHDDWGRAAWSLEPCQFGKTVFLTREEAEVALEGRRGRGEKA